MSIYILKETDLVKIIEYCSIQDFINFSSTNSYFINLLNNDLIWKNLIHGFYFSRVQIEHLIIDSGLNQIHQTQEPESWKQYAREVFETSKDESAKDLELAREKLENFQSNPSDIQLLLDATYIALNCLVDQDLMSFYILAFICYILNHPKNALLILDMALELDPSFGPVLELKSEVQALFDQLQGQGKAPLTDGNNLSQPFQAVLTEIFQSFDRDQDKLLNFNELNQLITAINKGSQPPAEFIKHIINHFQTNSPSGIALRGFFNFFLYQALEDPEETRNDLGSLGYDPFSLRKLEEMMNGLQIN